MKWVLFLVSVHALDRPINNWYRYETEKACHSHIAEYLALTDGKDGVKYLMAECHKVSDLPNN
jgi:hypothetical protein